MEDRIRVHFCSGEVTTLGPGRRFVLWVQGCHGRCAGCLAPQTHDLWGGTWMDIDELVVRVFSREPVDGLTISGGEPFLQAEALAEWIARVRAIRDMGVIVYTGYAYLQLLGGGVPGAERLLAAADLLVDGPYLAEQDDGGSLRGSANQNLVFLTERYRADQGRYGVPGARRVEFRVKDSAFFVVGVPPSRLREVFHRLRETGAEECGRPGEGDDI